jgi:hypothetical protein
MNALTDFYIAGKYEGIYKVINSVRKESGFYIFEVSTSGDKDEYKQLPKGKLKLTIQCILRIIELFVGYVPIFVGVYDFLFVECVMNMGYVSMLYFVKLVIGISVSTILVYKCLFSDKMDTRNEFGVYVSN